MKRLLKIAALAVPAIALMGVCGAPAHAQAVPVVVPIVVDTAVPIVVNAVKPKPSGLSKFEGFVMNANAAQITVRAKSNELSIQTFTLSEVASTKMQQIVDKGGYQYGDRVTVLYDPSSRKAVKVKGKPSRPI
jgi:xanthosine utilization system XapX-like protein